MLLGARSHPGGSRGLPANGGTRRQSARKVGGDAERCAASQVGSRILGTTSFASPRTEEGFCWSDKPRSPPTSERSLQSLQKGPERLGFTPSVLTLMPHNR